MSRGDEVVKTSGIEAESLDESRINKQRRYFLIGATAAVGGVGVVGAAVPFVASWQPSAKARALGAPVRVDISKLRPGEMLGPVPAWRGQPIFVVYRTQETIDWLEQDLDNALSLRPGYQLILLVRYVNLPLLRQLVCLLAPAPVQPRRFGASPAVVGCR